MKVVAAQRSRIAWDRAVATASVLGLGAGTLIALAGSVTQQLPVALAGALVAALGLMVLLTAGWLDGLLLVALTLPLPALYSGPAVRIAAAAPITAMVVLAWSLRWGISGRRMELGGLPLAATVALLAWFTLATAFAQYRLTSLRELLNLFLLFGLLVAATDMLCRAPTRVRRLIRILVWAAAVCGVLAVLEAVGAIPGRFPRVDTPFYRAALGFGQPNSLGLFLAAALPFAEHERAVAQSPRGRLAATAAVCASALGLLATFSRGSWVALLCGAMILVLAGCWRQTFWVWALGILGGLVVDVLSGGAIRDTIQRTFGDWVVEQRAALMLAGVFIFLDHPVIGVGPGGFARHVEQYGIEVPQLWDIQDTPHNAYVQVGAEAGVLGVVTFAWFLLAALRVSLREARRCRHMRPEAASLTRTLLWSLGTIGIAGLFMWPFPHGTGQAVMLVLAMAFASAAFQRSPPAGADS